MPVLLAYNGSCLYKCRTVDDSHVHRDNILNKQVTETEVGYMYDPNSEYGDYYTMVFAVPQ